MNWLKKLGISAVEIRRINGYRKGSVIPTGQVLTDGVGLWKHLIVLWRKADSIDKGRK